MSPTPAAPPPLTLVLGKEDLLAERAVAAVVTAARARDDATDVRRLPAVGLERGTVSELLGPSLFGERRVVAVTGLHEAADELLSELKALVVDLPGETHLVLVHRGGNRGKALLAAARAAHAVEVNCPEIKYDSDKQTFVLNEFRGARRKISAGAARALVEALGSDLRELANACSQLIADTTGIVEEAVIERYYGGRVEASGFKVADKVLEGRPEEALVLLRHALATGVAPVLVTSALANALRVVVRVGSVRRSAPSGEVARELGLAPWMVDKARRQLQGWTAEGLDHSIRSVARADAAVKGAEADPVYALERAVLAVARARG
jgi:DNA polymerase-3 subunit delta